MSNYNQAQAFNEYGGAVNTPPQFNDVGTITAVIGAVVSLGADITITDDGTVVTLAWTQVGGNDATINNPGVKNANIDTSALSEGTRTFRLTATDDEGATSYIERDLVLALPADVTPPVISLNGPESVTLRVGETYTPPPATALDERDGDVTERITINNPVDMEQAGTYTVTFNATDLSDNAAEPVTQTVIVEVYVATAEEVLEILSLLEFEIVNDGNVTAYYGRANRERFRLKPTATAEVDLTKLALIDEFLDFSKNHVTKVELLSNKKTISSETNAVMIKKESLLVRLGDLTTPGVSGRDLVVTFIVYVGDDTRGIVMSGRNSSKVVKMEFYEEASAIDKLPAA
ncbi:DUF5011 domain-containing protein [Alteromonas pelagimontana]|uniref:DUF5011 domain-containing protein n=1 Tax=Alteromonas pelagimontana TaxID=1858656 RepID=A0A6M4M8R9_9ALTE|nr:immunoglobulin-like domain-containing protein [Alteromonas pelagimontana]QJR79594.1 DUF5011 domain-containing protein [Alteromonas pelagimontana]